MGLDGGLGAATSYSHNHKRPMLVGLFTYSLVTLVYTLHGSLYPQPKNPERQTSKLSTLSVSFIGAEYPSPSPKKVNVFNDGRII